MSKRIFAVIAGNQVIGKISMQDHSAFGQRQAAALSSQPTVIETTNTEVGPGWIWDGTDFVNPEV
jgi:hypothetical protein